MSADDFGNPRNPYAASKIAPPVKGDPLEDDLGNPLKSIWIHPRRTIRKIVATDPTLYVVLLTCLAGIGSSLDRASSRDLGDRSPVALIIFMAVCIGPIGGLISLWIFSHLVKITGQWIGGESNRENIKAAIAWAAVPSVFSLVFWVINLSLFGSEMFTAATPRMDANPTLALLFLGIGIIEFVIAIWSLVILCNTVAEVQGFHSAWSGLGNIILAGLLLVIPIIGLVLLLTLVLA